MWTRSALRALKVAATRAGLLLAGLHTLRHSAAGVLLNSGVPLEVVSEILGHSSIAITGRHVPVHLQSGNVGRGQEHRAAVALAGRATGGHDDEEAGTVGPGDEGLSSVDLPSAGHPGRRRGRGRGVRAVAIGAPPGVSHVAEGRAASGAARDHAVRPLTPRCAGRQVRG
ncbi:MAG TPA: tyrosine-type recombinase/integrase, partial [Blastococcus sp.]|nr:tyrosine-type recombinase/integrase [Blastococcus sp.]